MVFGLLLAELSARAFLAMPQVNGRLKDDESGVWRRRWVGIQRGRQAAHPMIATDRYDEELGWHPLPHLDQVVKGAQLTTNGQGFRALADFSPRSPAGVRRVVALGDSFTFGEDVADEEAWPRILERQLPDTEVLNLGVHGYGHDQMLLLLRRQGIALRPDTVLLGFVGLDLSRNRLDFRDAAKPRFGLRDGRLVLEGNRVPTRERVLALEPWRPALGDLLSLAAFRRRQATGDERRQSEVLGQALLNAIATEAAAAGARPAFLYLPTGADVGVLDRQGEDERFFFAACRSIRTTQPSLTCDSARSSFAAAAARGENFTTGRHWGSAGHQAAADAAADLLRRLP
jgi:lysophospholipase L1-like esterase